MVEERAETAALWRSMVGGYKCLLFLVFYFMDGRGEVRA